jgi:hypothetical protein
MLHFPVPFLSQSVKFVPFIAVLLIFPRFPPVFNGCFYCGYYSIYYIYFSAMSFICLHLIRFSFLSISAVSSQNKPPGVNWAPYRFLISAIYGFIRLLSGVLFVDVFVYTPGKIVACRASFNYCLLLFFFNTNLY